MTTPKKTSEAIKAVTHLWSRLTTERWEDAWVERLSVAGPESLVIKAFPASRVLRLQVYTNKKMAAQLLKNFGGSVRPFDLQKWTPPTTIKATPLRIGKNLEIYNDKKMLLEAEKKSTSLKKKRLLVPAGMAFGTGDHATTSNCLRLLEGIQKSLAPDKWSLLDLGTGSGILALAGELLGAKKILGIDFDEQCVSIAQENGKVNDLTHTSFRHANLLKTFPQGTWSVVTANIYSSVLTAIAPKIVKALPCAGHLILSGILVVEVPAILKTFTELGMEKVTVLKRGKWCALLLVKKQGEE